MMRIFILILLVVGSAAAATEVYRWIDDNGETHYSDRPHEGAELVTLPEAQTFSMPAHRSVRRTSVTARDGQDAVIYQSVGIVSPTANEVLWNTGGLLPVSVIVQPELRRGHTLMIYLNGRVAGSLTGNQRELELADVFRGEHSLRAEIRDAGGRVVGKGNAVQFTVKQTSAQNQNNPNAPARPGPGG